MKIVSHNAFWFQGHPFATDQPTGENPEIFAKLCALYQNIDADILCIQEVQNEDVAEKTRRTLEMNAIYAPGNIHRSYGAMIASRTDYSIAEVDAGNSDSLLERSLVVAEIAGLTIANIHLTSGRQSLEGNAGDARCREIEGFLSACGERTDVILGDFNECGGNAVSRKLEAAGFRDAALVSGRAGIPTVEWGDYRFDAIWIKERLVVNLRGYGVIREGFAADGVPEKTLLSDHYPVWIDLDFQKVKGTSG